jgi:hypothetical protein
MRLKTKTLLSVCLPLFPLIATVDQASGAAKQTLRWKANGACVDVFENGKTEYILNNGNTCDFTVTVKPAIPSRTIALQFFDDVTGQWTTGGRATTNKKGVTRLGVVHTVKDGDCGEDSTLQFRLNMASKGPSKEQNSDSFWITYIMDECK